MMDNLVIIGAGECGVRAAFALRENGYAGSLTLIGREAALPYERPPLSKSGSIRPIRPAAAYEDDRIVLRLDREVHHIDRSNQSVILSSGEVLHYDRLLLATGARARLFPSMDGCMTLRTDRDAEAILSRITRGAKIGVIGGGFIGLELAALARTTGVEVTVFEAGPRLLGRAVPAQIAQVLEERHLAEGVCLEFNAAVTSASSTEINLADGRSVPFDTVIAGVGSVPETDLAAAAGLVVNDGIVVDADFRTSYGQIFAAGDCCAFDWRGKRVRLESWKAAQDQGEHAALAMLGRSASYNKVPWFWSDQFDLGLQVAGIFDLRAPIRSRSANTDSMIVFQCDDAQRLVAAAGIGPGNSTSKDIKVLEKLIERGGQVDADQLADHSQNLKRLLTAA